MKQIGRINYEDLIDGKLPPQIYRYPSGDVWEKEFEHNKSSIYHYTKEDIDRFVADHPNLKPYEDPKWSLENLTRLNLPTGIDLCRMCAGTGHTEKSCAHAPIMKNACYARFPIPGWQGLHGWGNFTFKETLKILKFFEHKTDQEIVHIMGGWHWNFIRKSDNKVRLSSPTAGNSNRQEASSKGFKESNRQEVSSKGSKGSKAVPSKGYTNTSKNKSPTAKGHKSPHRNKPNDSSPMKWGWKIEKDSPKHYKAPQGNYTRSNEPWQKEWKEWGESSSSRYYDDNKIPTEQPSTERPSTEPSAKPQSTAGFEGDSKSASSKTTAGPKKKRNRKAGNYNKRKRNEITKATKASGPAIELLRKRIQEKEAQANSRSRVTDSKESNVPEDQVLPIEVRFELVSNSEWEKMCEWLEYPVLHTRVVKRCTMKLKKEAVIRGINIDNWKWDPSVSWEKDDQEICRVIGHVRTDIFEEFYRHIGPLRRLLQFHRWLENEVLTHDMEKVRLEAEKEREHQKKEKEEIARKIREAYVREEQEKQKLEEQARQQKELERKTREEAEATAGREARRRAEEAHRAQEAQEKLEQEARDKEERIRQDERARIQKETEELFRKREEEKLLKFEAELRSKEEERRRRHLEEQELEEKQKKWEADERSRKFREAEQKFKEEREQRARVRKIWTSEPVNVFNLVKSDYNAEGFRKFTYHRHPSVKLFDQSDMAEMMYMFVIPHAHACVDGYGEYHNMEVGLCKVCCMPLIGTLDVLQEDHESKLWGGCMSEWSPTNLKIWVSRHEWTGCPILAEATAGQSKLRRFDRTVEQHAELLSNWGEEHVFQVHALLELGMWFFRNSKLAVTAAWKVWNNWNNFPFGDLLDSCDYIEQEQPDDWWKYPKKPEPEQTDEERNIPKRHMGAGNRTSLTIGYWWRKSPSGYWWGRFYSKPSSDTDDSYKKKKPEEYSKPTAGQDESGRKKKSEEPTAGHDEWWKKKKPEEPTAGQDEWRKKKPEPSNTNDRKNEDGTWKDPWHERASRKRSQEGDWKYRWQNEDWNDPSKWKRSSGSAASSFNPNPVRPNLIPDLTEIYLKGEWNADKVDTRNAFSILGLKLQDAGNAEALADAKKRTRVLRRDENVFLLAERALTLLSCPTIARRLIQEMRVQKRADWWPDFNNRWIPQAILDRQNKKPAEKDCVVSQADLTLKKYLKEKEDRLNKICEEYEIEEKKKEEAIARKKAEAKEKVNSETNAQESTGQVTEIHY